MNMVIQKRPINQQQSYPCGRLSSESSDDDDDDDDEESSQSALTLDRDTATRRNTRHIASRHSCFIVRDLLVLVEESATTIRPIP